MADRGLSGANLSAVQASSVKAVAFVRMDFLAGIRRFHTLIGDLTITHPIFGAETYNGIGDFGGISAVEETIDSRAVGVKLVLSGVSTPLITALKTDTYHRRPASLLIGLRNLATGVLVDDPIEVWAGVMDKGDIGMAKNSGRIVMNCESDADTLRDTSGWLFNDEDQQAIHPGDKAFEYLDQIALMGSIRWGDKTAIPPLGSPGGRGGDGSPAPPGDQPRPVP